MKHHPLRAISNLYQNVLLVSELDRKLNECLNQQEKLLSENALLKDELLYIKKQNNIYANALFRSCANNEENNNEKFFQYFAPASGNMRIHQLGNVKLLSVFVQLCNAHGLKYWAQSGTLLGTVRHKGFVPWDDDTDVAMFRNDIWVLRDILKNNDEYKISLVYDYNWKSRQFRFRTRDCKNPCFIDIYIYDYCLDYSDELWIERNLRKKEIVSKFEGLTLPIVDKWREMEWIDADTELGNELGKLYDSIIPKEGVEVCGAKNAVLWGIDNFECRWKRLFSWDFLFPTVSMSYEGVLIEVPNKYIEYLNRQYGNIWELPKDLVTHYKHIDHENIDIESINLFLKK